MNKTPNANTSPQAEASFPLLPEEKQTQTDSAHAGTPSAQGEATCKGIEATLQAASDSLITFIAHVPSDELCDANICGLATRIRAILRMHFERTAPSPDSLASGTRGGVPSAEAPIARELPNEQTGGAL